MWRPDLWSLSAARVEIDHRAREARLRLEQIERLLISRVLPKRPQPRPIPRRRGLRFFRRVRANPIDQGASARSMAPSNVPYPD